MSANRFSRRDLLKITATLPAWTVAPTLANLKPRLAFINPQDGPAGDVFVVIFQRGGVDAINTVIPYQESSYYDQRPSLAIPEPASGNDQTAIDLDGFFGLHPNLRPLKDIWDSGDLAFVHACGSHDPTHSHFDAMDFMERGTPGEKSVSTGWLARHLQTAAWENESPFRAIGFGSMLQGSLRGPVPVTVLRSITDFHLGGRTEAPELALFQASLNQLYSLGDGLDPAASLTFDTSETLARLIDEQYTPEGVDYPQGEFGQALQQTAQLIKAGVGLEIAAVDIGGWDTHANQGGLDGGSMPNRLTELGLGLAAFYADLGDLMKTVTVITMSEFGRRLDENASRGTDHGHGGLMMALGGNVNGGKVYGDWPGLSPDALYGPGDLAITTDFRDILAEVIQNRLANPNVSDIFPGLDEAAFRGIV
jgi:uncharacterized protein (DUF1501 family)